MQELEKTTAEVTSEVTTEESKQKLSSLPSDTGTYLSVQGFEKRWLDIIMFKAAKKKMFKKMYFMFSVQCFFYLVLALLSYLVVEVKQFYVRMSPFLVILFLSTVFILMLFSLSSKLRKVYPLNLLAILVITALLCFCNTIIFVVSELYEGAIMLIVPLIVSLTIIITTCITPFDIHNRFMICLMTLLVLIINAGMATALYFSSNYRLSTLIMISSCLIVGSYYFLYGSLYALRYKFDGVHVSEWIVPAMLFYTGGLLLLYHKLYQLLCIICRIDDNWYY